MNDDEFLFFWIDSIVGLIQYGQRTTLCNSLKGKNAEQQFRGFCQGNLFTDIKQDLKWTLQQITIISQKQKNFRR